MLFNSYIFILFFLPVSLIVFYKIGVIGHHRIAVAWLVCASLFFYGWWNPAYLGLILGSILFNYAIGVSLSGDSESNIINRRLILAVGITTNLALLGYFKYANFFVDNINLLTDSHFNLQTIILPLAISFFTFQQIAYLVDAYKGETREYNFLHYCLFVTFFPQLIAGPIVHHREMLPQFANKKIYSFSHENFAVGISIFVIGLFKKVVLADGIAVYATPVFSAADGGATITFIEGWIGALAYTFQLYFDFSGYADMAIGIARMFGIRLPLNFNSPYKANNIIDFWRRWHITLSRFLRDYIYIPLGGSRKGKFRRYSNLMITMFLGGLWHGAGWTFIIWGILHGLYLILNHMWNNIHSLFWEKQSKPSKLGEFGAKLLTFLAVVVGWVFFRAESTDAAIVILKGMIGLNGVVLPSNSFESFGWSIRLLLSDAGVMFGKIESDINDLPSVGIYLICLLVIVWWCPNTQQIMSRYKPALDEHVKELKSQTLIQWQPSVSWAVIVGVIATYSLFALSNISEFLYFQF